MPKPRVPADCQTGIRAGGEVHGNAVDFLHRLAPVFSSKVKYPVNENPCAAAPWELPVPRDSFAAIPSAVIREGTVGIQ